MEHEWTMGEEDFLTYQLYQFKSSGKLKKTQRNGFFWVGLALFFAVLGFLQSDQFFLIYGVLFGVYMALFYFLLYKRRLKRHFTKHVQEHYHERFDKKGTLKFGADWLYLTSEFSEMKVKNSQIQHFTELSEYLFIKLKYGEMVVIPKAKVTTLDALKSEIEENSDRLDVPFFKELSWKW